MKDSKIFNWIALVSQISVIMLVPLITNIEGLKVIAILGWAGAIIFNVVAMRSGRK